jgi:hypothetical protein
MINNVARPQGVVVLHYTDSTPIVISYSKYEASRGVILSLREKIMQRGDDYQTFANLNASMIAELKKQPCNDDVIRTLAAAVVHTAAKIAQKPKANCLSARLDHAYAAPGTQIGGYNLAESDPLEFLMCELQDITRAPAAARVSTGATLQQLINDMTQEVETFWEAAQAGDGWSPRVIASTPSGVIGLMCPDYDAYDRAYVFAELRQHLRDLGADSYVLASEAWMGDRTSDLPPSQQASRREIMLVCAADKSGNTDAVVLEMVRDSTGRVTKLVPVQGGGEGMRGLLLALLQ